jgi:hypothetical protein
VVQRDHRLEAERLDALQVALQVREPGLHGAGIGLLPTTATGVHDTHTNIVPKLSL